MNAKRHVPGTLLVVGLALGGLALGHAPAAAETSAPDHRHRAPSERTGVRIFLLDVEVTDEHGRPLPGLVREDFRVTINGRRREIYSVDDLCSCAAALPSDDGMRSCATAEEAPETAPAVARSDGAPGEAISYVLYFDFSQLQMAGRIRALAEARRWLREVKRPGEEVLLAAYSTQAGLQELTPFTTDRGTIESVLDDIEDDPQWFDPFPSLFSLRLENCSLCLSSLPPLADPRSFCDDQCVNNPRREYRHGRWSLEALQRLLVSLERQPGRKVMLAFQQNWTTFPGRFYPFLTDFEVGEHLTLLEQVGVEANHSRVAIWPAYTGDPLAPGQPSGQAVNVGANLADFSGGRYNRTFIRLPELTGVAGRGCACTYRIGLLSPPGAASEQIFRVKVEAASRPVPYRYRVQFLSDTERWWRQARLYLANPRDYDDLPVNGALLPVSCTDAGWNLSALVGVGLDSLMLFPAADGQRGEWEVGALLHRQQGRGKWEMLGTSEVRLTAEDVADRRIVHEHTFEKLPPGSYRLAAFVRDRVADTVGTTEATLTLPAPGRGDVSGPVVVRWGPQVRTTLPLMREAERAGHMRATIGLGASPEPLGIFGEDEQVQLLSWLCPGKDDGDGLPPRALRFLSSGDDALFRFDSVAERAGTCFKLTDTIATRALEPGIYRYHLRWAARDAGQSSSERTVEFRVAGAPPVARR